MKPCSTRWRRRPRLSSLAAIAALAGGCVTGGTHNAVVEERDTLQRRVEQLERSTESLDAERVKLIDELEDLRIVQEKLDRDVRSLRETEAELSASLAARDAELDERSSEVEKLRDTYEGLVQDLEAEVASGEIEIEQLREGLRLNLTQDVLFSSGSAEVNASGRQVLSKVAQRVKEAPNAIVVRGHTDNVPISSSHFPTNWELAGARASRVVRLLEEGGVASERLSAVSHGRTLPRGSNATPEGRARNRRIEITLEPVDEFAAAERVHAAESEPATAP
ncbi:MAG: OmpA family protein [Deltaproteobacteria bacterium]|nr:OmpA family protein [Deltaproteobacteria bacterium]MBW2359889.1 OmpA family protein [Deltaproteobacteria bacterium]